MFMVEINKIIRVIDQMVTIFRKQAEIHCFIGPIDILEVTFGRRSTTIGPSKRAITHMKPRHKPDHKHKWMLLWTLQPKQTVFQHTP